MSQHDHHTRLLIFYKMFSELKTREKTT